MRGIRTTMSLLTLCGAAHLWLASPAAGWLAQQAIPTAILSSVPGGSGKGGTEQEPVVQEPAAQGQQAQTQAKPAAKVPQLTVDEAIKAIQSNDRVELRKGAIALINSGEAAKKAVPTIMEVLNRQPLDGPTDLLFVLIELGPNAKDAVPVLIKYTGSSNFHARYLACRALGRIGEPSKPAVPIMIKMLDDQVASVRRNAAESLGRLGGKIAPNAVQPLMKATKDPLDPVREAAVLALGNFPELGQPAVPLLKEILQDERSTVRPEAAQSLWLLTKDADLVLPALKVLLKYGDLEWEAAQVMAMMGPAAEPAVPELIKSLRRDESVQVFAAAAFGSIGPAPSQLSRPCGNCSTAPKKECAPPLNRQSTRSKPIRATHGDRPGGADGGPRRMDGTRRRSHHAAV